MTKLVFLNDTFIEEDKACLHYRDLAFQRGYAVFDFFRLRENKPLFLDDHLRRFQSSADGLHLKMPCSFSKLTEIIHELIEMNNLPSTGMRLSLSGGYSEDGFNPTTPNLFISQHSFSPPTELQIQKGIKLLSYPYQRQLPHLKTIDYTTAISLRGLLSEKGFDELLYYNDNLISECPRSNFFIVTQNNVIITPAEGILKGITRQKVLDVAANAGFKTEERKLHLDELKTAKEAFITSTTKEILPVAQIDNIVLPQTDFSQRLLKLFHSTYNI